jgi:hypothetical protein
MLSSRKDDDDDDADPERNAGIAPMQETTEHSHVLTPNSFQNILSTPWTFLTKTRKRVSLITGR